MSNTIIGSSIVIDGEISGDERLVIQGTVHGKIAGKQAVAVERSAVIKAEIEAESIQIGGQVSGRIVARSRVEITPEGRVVGDIRAPRILIADGAQFKGNVDMD
jgi:cytoskeletal protein CcmA (bactofilin family)